MKIIQSSIEKLAWYFVVILVIGEIVIGYFAYQDGQIIKQNQHNGTNAVKTYIACLLKINPGVNLPEQEQACFNAAPQVRP